MLDDLEALRQWVSFSVRTWVPGGRGSCRYWLFAVVEDCLSEIEVCCCWGVCVCVCVCVWGMLD